MPLQEFAAKIEKKNSPILRKFHVKIVFLTSNDAGLRMCSRFRRKVNFFSHPWLKLCFIVF